LDLYFAAARGIAGLIEPLGKATFSKKRSLELAQLLVQKLVRLVNETDERVRGNLGRRRFDIGPIGRIGPILGVRQPPNHLRLRMVLCPKRESALPQKILVIEQKLLETRAGNAHQFQLGLLGRAAGLTSLCDVLAPAARGLHHLVVRARAAIDKPVAKITVAS
jgi:hypothetical protein